MQTQSSFDIASSPLALIALLGLSCQPLQAENSNSGSVPVVAVSAAAKGKLKAGHTIAVILASNEAVLTNLLEDALAIHLVNAGFDAFSREQLELALAGQVSGKKGDGGDTTIGTMDLAKSLGADFVVTGNAIVTLSDTQPVLVKVASLQVLDGASGNPLVQTLFDSKEGLRLTEISRAFIDQLDSDKK